MIGAGLPLLQRLKLLKQKQEREAKMEQTKVKQSDKKVFKKVEGCIEIGTKTRVIKITVE